MSTFGWPCFSVFNVGGSVVFNVGGSVVFNVGGSVALVVCPSFGRSTMFFSVGNMSTLDVLCLCAGPEKMCC